MTTAHRPTWKAAYGLSDSANKGYVPTRSYSARDLPSYLKLKERQFGQGSVDQLKSKDFKAQLLKKQADIKKKKNGEITPLQTIEQQQVGIDIKRPLQQDVDFIDHGEVRKKIKPNEKAQEHQNPFPEDADSQQFINEPNQQSQQKKQRIQSEQQDSQQEDSDQLLREYQKIKEQRQRQQLQKRQQQHKNSMMNRQAQLLKGNPLIDSSYSLSKRWYEQTVFRNQAKKIQENKNYINDYVRSQFHRKFMSRYIMR